MFDDLSVQLRGFNDLHHKSLLTFLYGFQRSTDLALGGFERSMTNRSGSKWYMTFPIHKSYASMISHYTCKGLMTYQSGSTGSLSLYSGYDSSTMLSDLLKGFNDLFFGLDSHEKCSTKTDPPMEVGQTWDTFFFVVENRSALELRGWATNRLQWSLTLYSFTFLASCVCVKEQILRQTHFSLQT